MKLYKDSTLMKMKKEELIHIIRCLEHNIEAAHEMNEHQFELLMGIDRATKDKNS